MREKRFGLAKPFLINDIFKYMIPLKTYIKESVNIYKVKPVGYVDNSEFISDDYSEYWLCLMKSIAKNTPLKRNNDSEGIWEEFLLDDLFILKSIKMTSIGKNSSSTKPRKISERIVSKDYLTIIDILFGKNIDQSNYNNFDSLANFITSSDYIYRNKERIQNIVNDFYDICVEKKLIKRLYKIKPWLKSKIDTIL